jgi:hypothetical protein
VNAYVLNQFCNHWLFFYALHAVITMALNYFLKSRTSPSMDNLMDDDLLLLSKCHSLYLTLEKNLWVLDGFL